MSNKEVVERIRKRMESSDLGIRVFRAAQSLSPVHISELMGVKEMMFLPAEIRLPMLKSHYNGDIIGPLVRGGMLRWTPQTGWNDRWRLATLTEFGERVLLCAATIALQETGRMGPGDNIQDEE